MNFRTTARVARIAAVISASIAAVGATLGFHEMTGDWLVAGLFGIGVASILGIGWHLAIAAAENARRSVNRGFLVAVGAALVAVAIATSGWSLVTAVGGKSALTAYQVEALAEQEAALNAANERLNAQTALVNNVQQSAAAARLLGDEEGTSGQGPLYRSYMRTASNLDGTAANMSSTLESADEVYLLGLQAVANAQANFGDEAAFREHMAEIARHTHTLNGVDVTEAVLKVGMVGLNDKGLPELTPLTNDLYKAAESVETETVDVPAYTSITRSEAVALAGERIIPAWVAAVAIDAAPFIFLLLVMFMANEPLMREQADPRRTTDREIRLREDEVNGIS